MHLDIAISDGIPNYDAYKKITIEHILPQNLKPGSHWLDWFSQEEIAGYRHQLSNLVLLSLQKNSYASNHDF